MRQAMTEEDARIQNIINSLMGVENNYFGQANTMADNILNRVNANANRQQEVNKINTQARNQWANNLMNAAVGGGAALLSGAFAPSASMFGYNLWGGQ